MKKPSLKFAVVLLILLVLVLIYCHWEDILTWILEMVYGEDLWTIPGKGSSLPQL